MVIPDVNALIHAAHAGSPDHARVLSWWEGALNGTEPVGLPWVVATGFLRIVTNRRILEAPYEPAEALDIVEGWLQHPNVTVVGPRHRHAALLRDFVQQFGTGGNAIPDAHIAAIAAEHDATLWSTDRGFARLEGLRWRDPLVG